MIAIPLRGANRTHLPQSRIRMADWARAVLRSKDEGDTIMAATTRYGFRAISSNGATATIARISDHPNGLSVGAKNMSQAQADAFNHAKLLIQRNGDGDKDRARALLAAQFDDVLDT